METKHSFLKTLLLACLAAFLARRLAQRQAAQRPTKPLDTKDGWQPLAPIRKGFWLRHPQRAFHFFLLQQSLEVTWRLAKKYLARKA